MPITRIPLSWPYNPRRADTSKDQRRVNVMDEKVDGKTYTLKRPGTTLLYNYGSPGPGQGMTFYNGATYSVVNDQLAISSVNNDGTRGINWQAAGVADWSARSSFATVNVQGTIYVAGGLVDTAAALNTPTADVWSITPGTGWQLCTAAAPWTPRAEMTLLNGAGDTALLLIGGIDGTGPQNDVWSSPDGVNWTQLVKNGPWTPRYGAVGLSAGGNFFLMGGTNGSTVYNDIWVSINGTDWAELLPNADWSARAFAAAYAFPFGTLPAIWIAGGADSFGNGINETWYSTNGGKNWTLSPASFSIGGVYAGGYCVYNNRMWLVNGRTGPTVASSINYVYTSPDGLNWYPQTTMGPWQASCSGALVSFPTATSVSPYNYQSLYWLGGNNTAGVKSDLVYYGTLDTIQSLSGGISPAIAGQPYQFAPFQEGTVLLVKNQCGLWVVAGGSINQVKSNGYPGETVPGLCVLGSYAYVMDRSGLIHNCDADNPYQWQLLNVVGADYEADPAVALVKYLNYIVAFGTYTMQLFYDAGQPVGSPLLPYLNANVKIGCADAATVVDVGPSIMWVSRTQQFNRQVMIMNGMTPQVVSTPAIDKLLNGTGWTSLIAFSYYADGHLFYVLSSGSSFSLACDTSQQGFPWYEWTDITGTQPLFYSGSCSTLDEGGFQVQALLDGTIYTVGGQYYTDNGAAFPVQLRTAKVDFDNMRRKFWGRTTLVGDQNTGMPTICNTDDDYQTYSTPRTVDTSTPCPSIPRNGASLRRAWLVDLTNDQPLRWEALEVEWEQGNVPQGQAG